MEVTIKINTKLKSAKTFLEFIKSLNFVEIVEKDKPSKLLRDAISESKNKKTTKIKGKDKLTKYLTDAK